MTWHLSDDEISAWVIGEGTAMQKQHVADCAECGARIGQLQAALTGFRESAILWSAGQQPGVVFHAPAPWWRVRSPWLVAAAALLLMTAYPAYQSYSAHLTAARERALLAVAEDTALLKQVNAQVSRAVPGAMEPLVTLIAWNGSSLETNSERKGNNENLR